MDTLDREQTPVYSKALDTAIKFDDIEISQALIAKGACLDLSAQPLTASPTLKT